MTDFLTRVHAAREKLQLDWSVERAEHNRRAVLRRRPRRAIPRAAALVAMVCLGLLVGWAALRHGTAEKPFVATSVEPPPLRKKAAPVPPAPPVAAAAPVLTPPATVAPPPLFVQTGAELRFRDGSRATLVHEGSRLISTEDAPGRSVLKLLSGGARFNVVHDPSRVFRVDTPDGSVEVLGTRFSVERSTAGLRVSVEHGRVRVVLHDGLGSVELTDGQERIFPHAVPRSPDWRALAEEGQFERAYRALSFGPLSEVSAEPGELLILADVARLSRHPAQAVPPLRKVIDAHPGDPRAPLAAFTLGRVLLDDLGRPQQAAAAFFSAQQLDPQGPMAEDALAREVEAWSRAGDLTQARARAEEYTHRYPTGSRRRSVRRYGGLD